MRRTLLAGLCSFMLCLPLGAAEPQPEGPSLTIYNQKFGIVRQMVPLGFTAGINHVTFSDIAAHAEPDSVVLRDLHGGGLRLLEQNYRNDRKRVLSGKRFVSGIAAAASDS